MKQIYCDVLIVGSGLTGIVAAYALSLLKLNIIIVDQKKIFSQDFVLKKTFNEDTRTTAVAEGSKEFLEKINLWKGLYKFAEPIKMIKVIDRKPSNTIEFVNSSESKNLGYIVQNNKFSLSIINKIIKRKNVKIIDRAKLKKIDYLSDKIICKFNNFKIAAKLTVASDGKNSSARLINNTKFYKKNYKENAVVVNFEHSKNHNNCAYEFFYENGPLAILPAQKNLNYQSSLIWTNKKSFLENLINMDEKTFKKIIEEKIFKSVGKIIKIKSKQIFPLSSHINYKFYENKLVYIGDAAHSVHPIAGQGWNLGLRDVKKLFYLVKEYKDLGMDIGSIDFCKRYNQECFYDAYRLFQITDKLNSLFMTNNIILKGIRTFGLDFIQGKTELKKKISNFAMGLNL